MRRRFRLLHDFLGSKKGEILGTNESGVVFINGYMTSALRYPAIFEEIFDLEFEGVDFEDYINKIGGR